MVKERQARIAALINDELFDGKHFKHSKQFAKFMANNDIMTGKKGYDFGRSRIRSHRRGLYNGLETLGQGVGRKMADPEKGFSNQYVDRF